MITTPHNASDLFLAPVALLLDQRIEQLGALPLDELTRHVAEESDLADWTSELRADALMRTLARLIDLRGWDLTWHERGLAMAHGSNRVVLGVPATFWHYLEGTPVA